MAGKVVVSTLNNDTGVLATQNGMTGIAKAWVNFDGTGTPTIRGSFNVSSITDRGTGLYTINFTTAMPNANYSVVGSVGTSSFTNVPICSTGSTSSVPSLTTTSTTFITYAGSGTLGDCEFVCVSVFSS